MALPSPNQVAGINAAFYEALYQQVDPAGTDRVGAMEAAGFLKKSRLSDSILSKIWDISDPNGKGFLDKRGFFVALKLVSLAQNGNDISLSNINFSVPPPAMGDSTGRMSPAMSWAIKPAELIKYEELFYSLGPIENRIGGNVVKPIMLNSGLPTEALVKVWELSDMDQDGALDRDEFVLAMHLVAKGAKGFPIPSVLPSELLPVTKRKLSLLGGVSVMPDLLPGLDSGILMGQQTRRSSTPPADVSLKNALNKVVVAAPWVVGALEKSKSDELFLSLDMDMDGYVTGLDIKDTLLQSGLPPVILGHIWNLCDIKQSGKLNSEQFALAMFFISNNLKGMELPAQLLPEMIPPTLRPKPGPDSITALLNQDTSTLTTTGNKELDILSEDIKQLQSEKMILEEDIVCKEAEMKAKNGEVQGLQKEQETLAAMLKQLEVQKQEAQKRLTDLETQQSGIVCTLMELKSQVEEERAQVDNLRNKVDDQKKSLENQEEELNSKRQELSALRNEEQTLDSQIKGGQNKLDTISKSLQDTQLQISQAKAKINQLQEQQRQMNDGIGALDSAIASGSYGDVSLRAATPLSELDYQRLSNTGTSSPTSNVSAFSVPDVVDSFKEDPFKSKDPFGVTNGFDVDPFAGEDPFKSDPFQAEVVTSNGGMNGGFDSDPFANGFPSTDPSSKSDPFSAEDPFGSFPSGGAKVDPFDAFGNVQVITDQNQFLSGDDPFGSDPFAPGAPVAPPRPESPTPALPPKKSKAPPPRPAPPRATAPPTKSGPTRAAPAPPPPPTAASMAAAHDPFSSVPNTNDHTADPFAPFFDDHVKGGQETNNGFDDPFASKDPFASNGADPFTSGEDPFASSHSKGDPFASQGDPFASASSDSFANFADFEKFSPPPPYYPYTKTRSMSTEDEQLAWAMQEGMKLEEKRLQRAAKQEADDLALALALSREETQQTSKKKPKSKLRKVLF